MFLASLMLIIPFAGQETPLHEVEINDPVAILIDISHLPEFRYSEITVSGTIEGSNLGFIVSVSNSSISGFLNIIASINGIVIFGGPIDVRHVDGVDISTLEVRGDVGEGEFVSVMLKAGDWRPCFANDDGRDRLHIVMRQGVAPEVAVESFADCEAEAAALTD